MAHGGPHNLFDRLAGGARSLFGGPTDPRLSREENIEAGNQGLIESGLMTLLASGPDGMSPSVLQAISQGALAGRVVLRLAGPGVIAIVVPQAQVGKVVLGTVPGILVQMCNLPLCLTVLV